MVGFTVHSWIYLEDKQHNKLLKGAERGIVHYNLKCYEGEAIIFI